MLTAWLGLFIKNRICFIDGEKYRNPLASIYNENNFNHDSN